MTKQELDAEWGYRFQERIGILCGMSNPTREEVRIAQSEADRAIKELSLEEIIL